MELSLVALIFVIPWSSWLLISLERASFLRETFAQLLKLKKND